MATRELGPVAFRTIRGAVAERAVEEPAELDQRRVSLLDAEIDDPLHRSPVAGTTTMPAPPRPRQSPPSASAASSAASRRSASEPVADENVPHRLPDPRRLDEVRLRDPVGAPGAAGGRHAVRARPLARAPVDRHHPHLAELGQLVVGTEARERVGSGDPVGHQLEPAPPIPPVGERLGGDRADAGPCPGDGGCGVERLRLHRDADLPALRITADDRVRHGRSLSPCLQRSRGAVSRTSRRRCTALRGSRSRASMALPRDPNRVQRRPESQ